MTPSWYPMAPGDKITAAKMNELVEVTAAGTIFNDTTSISADLNSMASRMTALEARVTQLEQLHAYLSIREQKVMTLNQSTIPLSKTPILDTELVFHNGISLSKSNVPTGFSGDYTISGSTLTLTSGRAALVEDGDVFVVHYRYEA